MQIESKLPDVGVTIFTTMTALANQHGAINLSQGFPDFDVDPRLVERIHHHMRQGQNQYAPMQGVVALREKIAAKVKQLYGAAYDPITEITVTSGATEALFDAITAIVRPGDEVIVFEPAFDSYVPAIRLAGGRPIFIKLKFPDYRINWNQVAACLTAKTRCIIINSPHNPTGAILSAKDIAALSEIISGSAAFIISDEVYEHIIFDDNAHESLCRYPDLAERSFIISSFGKTYHTTGWKTGYCLAPEVLSRELQRIHQYVTFATNTPVQCAYADILDFPDIYLALPAFYQEKRDLFLKLLKESRFKTLPSYGTYFQMLGYEAISDEPDVTFAKRLTVEHGVAAIPPSAFYHQKDDHRVLRFCFAKHPHTLKKAAQRLCAI